MASKKPSSVIGVDVGRYSLKGVVLQRKAANRLVLTHYGSHIPAAPATDAETLTKQLRALIKDMGGSSKSCAVSISHPEAIIRLIEQPETPPNILREALRLNGLALLNQDCKSFVLDCDHLPSAALANPAEPGQTTTHKYLVGGIPRTEVQTVGTAVEGASMNVQAMQLAPIAVFNAFEFAHPEIFNDEAFFLVDIGHLASTMLIGVKRELVLVRSIDFGGKALLEALSGLSGEGADGVFEALEQEDEVMVEYTRVALNALIREIQNSIGFLEHRHEETISKIYVSGGPAKSQTLLKVLAEELNLPCESWSAVNNCEAELPADQAATLARDSLDLNVACGAAAELLKAS